MTRAAPASAGLRSDDPELIGRLRRVVDDADYTARGIVDALGGGGTFAREFSEIPYHLRLVPEPTPRNSLIKLFLLGASVAESDAEAALAPLGLESLERMGLIRRAGGEVEAAVDLVPSSGMLLASDRLHAEGLPERRDYVYGHTPAATRLVRLTARPRSRSALDLCTGSGLHALLAARHSEHVVATDLNPRALEFARFNALLNGIENVETREGDMLGPVEGETFDLIVCNPPFVISPAQSSEYLFRDSGMRGDLFCERLVRRLPAFLREGGLAHLLVSWTHGPDEDWSEPLRAWLDGSGCDALFVRFASSTPVEHAAQWNRGLGADDAAFAQMLDRWMEFFRQAGVERIAWGAIVLRRRNDGAPNWIWAETMAEEPTGDAGEHVLRICANEDFLAGLGGDEELLDATFALAEDHVLYRSFRLEDGTGVIDRAGLRLEGGLGWDLNVDGEVLGLVSRLDGASTLREVLAAEGVEGENVAEALRAVRQLLELGLIVPA